MPNLESGINLVLLPNKLKEIFYKCLPICFFPHANKYMKRSHIILFLLIASTKHLTGQILDIPKHYLEVGSLGWEKACELRFLYQNLRDSSEQVALSMIFSDQRSGGFFWKCKKPGFVPFDNFFHRLHPNGNITSHLGYHRHDVLLNGPEGTKFLGARLKGRWYKVSIPKIETQLGINVAIHKYELEDTYEIHYAPNIGILSISKNGVTYNLTKINGANFDYAKGRKNN